MLRGTIVVGTAVAVLAGAGGAAAAYERAKTITEPNAKGVITLCYDTSTGKPRMVSSGARCGSGEHKLTWQQRTPRPVLHAVGGAGEPAYAQLWLPYNGPPFGNLSYYRDASGIVHLTGLACYQAIGAPSCGGLLAGGTSPVFTLPSGFRPATQQLFTTLSYGSGDYYHTRLDVTPDGVVEVVSPPSAGLSWVSFDGISFLAG